MRKQCEGCKKHGTGWKRKGAGWKQCFRRVKNKVPKSAEKKDLWGWTKKVLRVEKKRGWKQPCWRVKKREPFKLWRSRFSYVLGIASKAQSWMCRGAQEQVLVFEESHRTLIQQIQKWTECFCLPIECSMLRNQPKYEHCCFVGILGKMHSN